MTFGVNDSPLAGRDGTHVSQRYSDSTSSGFFSTIVSLHLVFLLLHYWEDECVTALWFAGNL